MINLIIKLFVKDYENTEDLRVREKYGVLSGALGIICNVILFISKYIVGAITGSISITADSFNNLSDAAASVVTMVGFRISNKEPDDEHPFGHGRMEYISAMIVSFLILLMGLELIKSSVAKIIDPQPISFSYISLGVLAATVFVKLWMAYYNRTIGKRINSPVVEAAAADSLNDTLATGASILALVLSQFTSLPVDGIIGVMVALFVIFAGIGVLKETAGMLMGKAPDKEFVESLEKEILSYEGISGIHDLVVHNYGSGRTFVSVHAEVDADVDVLISHDTIDLIEREVSRKFKISLVIHMDPVITDDERINDLKSMTQEIVNEIEPLFSMHDFRVVDGPTHTNLIFDVVVPHNYKYSDSEIINMISEKLQKKNDRYFAVVTVDKSFVSG